MLATRPRSVVHKSSIGLEKEEEEDVQKLMNIPRLIQVNFPHVFLFWVRFYFGCRGGRISNKRVKGAAVQEKGRDRKRSLDYQYQKLWHGVGREYWSVLLR